MPKTDGDFLGPQIERRLRSALDRVEPRFSAARYATTGPRPWRLAPVAMLAAIAGVVVLSVSAAFVHVSPAVVMNRISTAIQPVQESTTPGPKPRDEEGPNAVAPIPRSEPEASEKPEPKEAPEPAEQPEPSSAPEPGDGGHSDSGESGSAGDH